MPELEIVEIGSALCERRQEMGLTLDDVAEQTKIRKTYIRALEEERFEELPGKVYVVGFLQNYARFLGVPVEPLVRALEDRDQGTTKNEKLLQPSEFRVAATVPTSKSPVRIAVWLAAVLLLLAVAGFYFVPGLIDSNRQETVLPDPPAPQTAVVQDIVQSTNVESRGQGTNVESSFGQAEADRQSTAPEASQMLPESIAAPPAIPLDGGTLKLTVNGEGHFVIAFDGGKSREYKAKPGLTLSWFVKKEVSLDLDIDGTAQLWLNQQEIDLTDKHTLRLVSVKDQEGGR